MGERKKIKGAAVGVQLTLTARAVRNALSHELAARGLYPGQDAVLLAIAQEEDGISLRDLAERLAVRPPTVTKTMTRLSAQGIVVRRASRSDARQSFVHLTDKGLGLVAEVRAARAAVERQALKGLKAKDARRLRKVLRRVERNFADAAPADAPAETDD
ncbi:MarR family transcriptional regulator [Aureimonas flava]|uniref:MarR family transcriptional regulator n=1 Tax=Aureimonas flava TaxID=2320271 RepID=A0A3A1WN65_9HYPH|nr:MarR family transcriptional regulator [Aureimonas flava]RIY01967.1 MarR family transcriptional regulator [Aureimonas flava]